MSDWGYIQKVKAELIAKEIENEKEADKQRKKFYKKQLDSQVFIKSLEKDEKRAMKDQEMNEMKNKVEAFQLDQEEKRRESLKKHQEIVDISENHKAYISNNKQRELLKSLTEDQKNFNFVQEKYEKTDAQKREIKDQWIKQHQEAKQMAEFKKEQKFQEREQEKIIGSQLAEEKHREGEKRDKEREDFLRLINVKQDQRISNFAQVTLPRHLEKEAMLNEWIGNNVNDYQRRQFLAQIQEEKKRQDAKAMNLEIMKKQLEEKEIEKLRNRNERQEIFEENIRKNNQLKHSETEAKIRDIEKKKNYMKALMQQTQDIQSSRRSPYELTETEKSLNKDFFLDKKPGLQMQGGNIISSRLSPVDDKKILSYNNFRVSPPAFLG